MTVGTRAAFWVGDPRDLKNRRPIGFRHYDGYPPMFDFLATVTTADEFERLVKEKAELDSLATNGFPYPWDDDVFLTDFTYALFDGVVQVTHFHCGFVKLSDELARPDGDDRPSKDDSSLANVPYGSEWNGSMGGTLAFVSRKP